MQEKTPNTSDVEVCSSESQVDPFSRFTPLQKRIYLLIVSLACFLSPISTTMFLPAVPEMAIYFNSTGSLVTLSNAVYCIMMAISPCITQPLLRNYGRRYTTIASSMGYTLTAFIVSQSRNLPMFYVFRAFMALFGTTFFSIGSTVIGDVFVPEERGRAMGLLLIGSQTGLAVAAVIGGVIIHYTSWRIIFIVQGGLGAVVTILSICFLKETGLNIRIIEYQLETGKKFKFYKFNPFKLILALRYEIVLIPAFISATLLYNMFALLTPITYVIKDAFHIESSILTSLFYLGPGTGFLVGSIVGGRYSDYNVKRYIKKRGERIPEDRLRSGLLFQGLAIPGSILLYGWSLDKHFGGIALPVVMMVINGFSQCVCFTISNSYCIDTVPHIASDAIANSYFMRFAFAAIANGSILPQIDAIGIGWTSTITAALTFLGFLGTASLILFGNKLKALRFPEYA